MNKPRGRRAKSEEKRGTRLSDIAESLGIAISTVSMALADDPRIAESTRALVQNRASELGFRPNPHAQRLLRGFTKGAVSLVIHDIDQGALSQTIRAIRLHLTQRGLRATIHVAGAMWGEESPSQLDLLRTIRFEKPEAIVCFGGGIGEKAVKELERYQEDGGKLVTYFSSLPIACDQVVFDERHNSELAVDHLADQGHRRIAFIAHGVLEPGNLRLEGFLSAMARRGLSVPDGMIMDGGLYEDGGREVAHRILKMRRRPTALCIVNDAQAVGFVTEMYRQGFRVPQYVSVVGTDDVAAARNNWIGITTTSMPVQQIADEVTDMVLSRVKGEYVGPPRRKVLVGDLIVRESTTTPRMTADEVD